MRVAAAPISWGICEVPGWGVQMDPGRVLEEMHSLGLEATEAGPDGFLPADPRALDALLAARGLRLVGGFVPLALHRPEGWREVLLRELGRLAACGAEVLVLAAATGADGYDARPRLEPPGWQRLLAALDEVALIAAGHGLAAVLHPHLGTLVERPDEIERVLEESAIPLCLDTGHVAAAGGDPAALAARAAGRIRHVHLKDVRADLASRLRAGRLRYREAVNEGLYVPLGEGDAGVEEVVCTLEAAGYAGWYVLEQDVSLRAAPPPGSGPVVAVARSLEWLTGRPVGRPG